VDRQSRNSAFHASLDEPWEGGGAAMLRRSQETGAPLVNMQMQPRHGRTGKTVAKSVGELESSAGLGHVQGAGLATGRVSRRMREFQEKGQVNYRHPVTGAERAGVITPSVRSQILAEGEDTYREHDLTPGHASVWAPEHVEDAEVRQAGLPPLRSSSRAGFMPGLGSVAMHRQEARAHQTRAEGLADSIGGLKSQLGNAQRRQKAAAARGDTAGAQAHGDIVKGLQGQMKGVQAEHGAAMKLVDHHMSTASTIANQKMTALKLLKSESTLDTSGHPSFGAAALATHKSYFDPETKEEFYPHASQAQLGMVAEGGRIEQTPATNVTAMGSAQRRWRNVDEETEVVSHPNLILAETFAGHVSDLKESGELDKLEKSTRRTARKDILAKRTAQSQHKHELDVAAERESEGPRPIKTAITPEHIEEHVQNTLAQHITSTYRTPAPLMGLADTHGRQMAKLLMAKSPEQMADVWATTDKDKRPTFALALAASHPNRSVRRQSAQAMTVDTHRAKELGIEYNRILGTTNARQGTQPGLAVTARQELPHQPGKSVQPGYAAAAMYGTRSALQMSAANFRGEGASTAAITPRYAQENPWGLFAAENMGDIQRAKADKRAGGVGQVRAKASGYYTEQAKVAHAAQEAHRQLHPRQFTDEDLFA
jgi:hypothetical protein